MAAMPQEQIVSIHTAGRGVPITQFLGSELFDITWTREDSQVSRCDFTIPSYVDTDGLPSLTPWLHWVSVYDKDDSAGEPLWTGPIQKTTTTRESIVVNARDMAALHARTRCPIKKRWDIAWPVDIAKELLDRLVEFHGLNVRPVRMPIHPLQYDERYDFAVTNDGTMVDKILDDLARLGLRWSVVAGVPILGPQSRTAFVSLTEDDFIGGGVAIVRDGSNTFNDVLLRGADNLAQATVPMGNLHLQTTVTIDNMFSASNVDRAAKQYVSYYGRIHDEVTLPTDAVLNPNAPVGIEQLIPTARVIVDANGLLAPCELTGITVSQSPEKSSTSLRLVAVNDELPELAVIKDRSSISNGKAANT